MPFRLNIIHTRIKLVIGNNSAIHNSYTASTCVAVSYTVFPLLTPQTPCEIQTLVVIDLIPLSF